MALPVLILAPIAAFLGGLATKLLDGVITLFTKKFLIHAALIILFVAIYASFMAGITELLSSVDLLTVPQILIDGFKILPTNTDTCIGLILSSKLVSLAYNIQHNILDIRKA